MRLAVRPPAAQLMLRFQRYLLPMAFLSNGTAKRISIAFTAQQLFKCNIRDDASKQRRHQVAIFREDERGVANQRIQGIIERRDIAGGRWGPGSR
jgi:hypothetical protein